jgi:hypothetical protein
MTVERKSTIFKCLLPIYVLPGGSLATPNCCSKELGPANSGGNGGGT